MKIAYLILVHKNPKQLVRLIESLQNDNDTFFVHLDKKCNMSEFGHILKENKNIKFISERVSINWGGFSMVEATINLIKNSLNYSQYDYFILLSGQDYPIKNSKDIHMFLEKNNNLEYINTRDIINDWKSAKIRYEQYHFMDIVFKGRYYVEKLFGFFIPKRNFYGNLHPFGGSQWWCLTKDCIKYIMQYIKKNDDIIKYFKRVAVPDEIFFHTIIMNSIFKHKVVNDNLRYINIPKGECHPIIYKENNFYELMNCNKLFARKFDLNLDSNIFAMIDKQLKN